MRRPTLQELFADLVADISYFWNVVCTFVEDSIIIKSFGMLILLIVEIAGLLSFVEGGHTPPLHDILFMGIPGLAVYLYYVGHLIYRRRHPALAQEEEWETREPIYEVGSPEYNAQLNDLLRTLNLQLEPEGKRIPERAVIMIIQQATGQQPGDQEPAE